MKPLEAEKAEPVVEAKKSIPYRIYDAMYHGDEIVEEEDGTTVEGAQSYEIDSVNDYLRGNHRKVTLCQIDLAPLRSTRWTSEDLLETVADTIFSGEVDTETGMFPPLKYELPYSNKELVFNRDACILSIGKGKITVKRYDYASYDVNILHALFMGLKANRVKSPFIAYTYGGFSATHDLKYSFAVNIPPRITDPTTFAEEVERQEEKKRPLREKFNVDFLAYQTTLSEDTIKMEREGEMTFLDLMKKTDLIDHPTERVVNANGQRVPVKVLKNRLHPSEAWALIELCHDVLEDAYKNHNLIHGDAHGHNWRVSPLSRAHTYQIGGRSHIFNYILHLIDWDRGSYHDPDNHEIVQFNSDYYGLPVDVRSEKLIGGWWHDVGLLLWGFVTSYSIKGRRGGTEKYDFKKRFFETPLIPEFDSNATYATGEIAQLFRGRETIVEDIFLKMRDVFANFKATPIDFQLTDGHRVGKDVSYFPRVLATEDYKAPLSPTVLVRSQEKTKIIENTPPCPLVREAPASYDDDSKTLRGTSREISELFNIARETSILVDSPPTQEKLQETREKVYAYLRAAIKRPETLDESGNKVERKIPNSEYTNISQIVETINVLKKEARKTERGTFNLEYSKRVYYPKDETIFKKGSEEQRIYDLWLEMALKDKGWSKAQHPRNKVETLKSAAPSSPQARGPGSTGPSGSASASRPTFGSGPLRPDGTPVFSSSKKR